MKPSFWKTRLDEMESILGTVKKGTVSRLAQSAGGRDIPMITYGEKRDFARTANYNSACGAKDPGHYAHKEGEPSVVLLVGGIHATEFEGISSLLNLVHIMETGEDFTGKRYDFAEAFEGRLIIIPIMNVDGRVRQPIDTLLGLEHGVDRTYNLAKWDDGRICEWPECKAYHPLPLDRMAHLGGYYNDNGVNFMHDLFFGEMQPETKALLTLVDREAPDFTLLLHSGGDMPSTPVQPAYVPQYINEKLMELSIRVQVAAERLGLRAGVDGLPDTRFAYPTQSFNLTSAIHHACGGVATTYESESVVSEEMYERILRMHYVLFDVTLRIERVHP